MLETEIKLSAYMQIERSYSYSIHERSTTN